LVRLQHLLQQLQGLIIFIHQSIGFGEVIEARLMLLVEFE
jgi:hypothetical protein